MNARGERGSTPRVRQPPTSEELRIVRLLAEGRTDESIARHFSWTRRTLQRRMRSILGKLGARSRFEAGVLAERAGWLQLAAEEASPPPIPDSGMGRSVDPVPRTR